MKSSIIFPLLLSFFPSWIIILKNYDELILQDLFIAGSFVGLTFGFWVLTKKLTKNSNKSSLIIGSGVGFFFYFGYIQDELKNIVFLGIPFYKTSILISICAIVFIIVVTYILKSKKRFDVTIKILNVIVITVILTSLMPTLLPNTFAEQPNVYHIILDEYTDKEILLKKFDYDNSKFIQFLENNDFQVANKVFSISPSTVFELNDILDMEYNQYDGWVSENYFTLNNNKVMSHFSQNGYTIIETNSMMRWKNFSDIDQKLCYNTNFINSEFLDQLLNKSIIRYFIEQHQENSRRDTVTCTFDMLRQIADNNSKPIFVFAHLYVPHPPFLFGPNGEHIDPDHNDISGLQSRDDPQGYVNQLIFATSEITDVIENIIEKDPSAIIILQGDTGTLTGISNNSEKSLDGIYQAHSILYAIRIDETLNLSEIIPINTYRIVFNHIFEQKYEMLQNYSWEYDENGIQINISNKLKSHSFGEPSD